MLLKENNTNNKADNYSTGNCSQTKLLLIPKHIYKPEKGVSMGSPILGTIAEIFLQHIENTHTKHLMDTKNIVYSTRYVDGILLIYDTKYTNADIIHEYINNIHTHIYN
jgi:hypothetical protein